MASRVGMHTGHRFSNCERSAVNDEHRVYGSTELTPEVIRTRQFDVVPDGYSRVEVEEFLEQIASAIEVLTSSSVSEAMRRELQRNTDITARMVIAAQEAAERLRQQALDDAQLIIEDTKGIAEELRSRGRQETRLAHEHVEELRQAFVEELREMYERLGSALFRFDSAGAEGATGRPEPGTIDPIAAEVGHELTAPDVDLELAPGEPLVDLRGMHSSETGIEPAVTYTDPLPELGVGVGREEGDFGASGSEITTEPLPEPPSLTPQPAEQEHAAAYSEHEPVGYDAPEPAAYDAPEVRPADELAAGLNTVFATEPVAHAPEAFMAPDAGYIQPPPVYAEPPSAGDNFLAGDVPPPADSYLNAEMPVQEQNFLAADMAPPAQPDQQWQPPAPQPPQQSPILSDSQMAGLKAWVIKELDSNEISREAIERQLQETVGLADPAGFVNQILTERAMGS